MTIDKIIEKFDERFVDKFKDVYGQILDEVLKYKGDIHPEDIRNFLRSSYSELLGEIVEEIEKCSEFADSEDTLKRRIISIINSKLPKEDSIN